jgi:hypothetical protein
MKLATLSPTMLDKIEDLRYDYILEEHEGPGRWAAVLEYYKPEFLRLTDFTFCGPFIKINTPTLHDKR